MRVHARLASLLLLPALAAGCAHAPSGGSGGRVTASATAAPVDSATLLLYRLDRRR
jgi:hypothetical protein